MFPHLKSRLSFGQRNAAVKYDVGLPKRYLSSDGTCFIEPSLFQHSTVAHANPSDAGIALSYVISQCVSGFPAQGGLAKNGGGNGDFGVRIIKFVPSVVCTDQPFPYDPVIPEACEAILDYMETSKQARLFTQAAVHEPGVEVSLPAYYAAPAEAPKCVLRVTGMLTRQFGNWYSIWEAANAIAAMCIRQGKGGHWAGLGATGSLTVEMGRASVSAASQE